MKKKFINGLLMVALCVGVTSTMVSCKDYDEEKLGNLESIVANNDATLRQLLAAQETALNKRIDDLNELIKQCQSNCKTFQEAITAKLDEYLLIKDFNTFKDGLGNIYYTKTEVDAQIAAALANTYDKATIDAMLAEYAKKADVYTKAEVDALLAKTVDELKELINAKASIESIIDLLNSGNNNLTAALNKYFTSDTEIANYIKQLIADNAPKGITEEEVNKLIANALVSVNAAITEAAAKAQSALDLAQANEGKITDLQNKYNTLETNVNNLTTNLNNLTATVQDLKTTVNGLDTAVKQLQNDVISLSTKVDAAQATADQALAQAEANNALIVNLQKNYAELSGKIDGLQMDVTTLRAMIDDVNEDIEDLEERVAQDEENAQLLHAQMLETISGLAEGISKNADNLGLLKNEFEAFKDEVSAKVAELMNSINANTQRIDKLVETFQNTLAKFITGIELNGTYNPMFGEFALPVGVRSNILVAFHGTLDDNGIQFPTRSSRFYALPDAQQWKLIDDEDIAMIGALNQVPGYITIPGNQNIVAGQKDNSGAVVEGNAGTLYLTVNPTDRDFTGTEFSIINSANQQSAVVLSDLAKSDHLLTWGYTRAGGPAAQSGNGFYETKATFTLDAVNNFDERMNVNLSDLKDLANEIRNARSGFSIANAANAIYHNISRVLEAKAVKATWTDDLGVRSVVSPYDLAVTTIKPLSFGFAKDVKFEDVVRLSLVKDFLDNVFDALLKGMPDLHTERISIEKIELDELTNNFEAKFHFYLNQRFIESNGPKSVSIPLPTITLTGDNGEKVVINNASPNVTVEINENDTEFTIWFNMTSILQHLGNYCSEPVENVAAQINDFLDDVNKFAEELFKLDVDNMQNKLTNNIIDYISNLAKRYKRLLTPNNYMQPIMLVKTSSSYARLSENKLYPSHFNGTHLLLVPTSYNADILTPAFKKFVAVTNVSKGDASAKGGDATCRSILDQANSQENLKTVIDGKMDHFIEFDAQRGYTYEVLYTSVDYAGLVFTQKYYFTIGE